MNCYFKNMLIIKDQMCSNLFWLYCAWQVEMSKTCTKFVINCIYARLKDVYFFQVQNSFFFKNTKIKKMFVREKKNLQFIFLGVFLGKKTLSTSVKFTINFCRTESNCSTIRPFWIFLPEQQIKKRNKFLRLKCCNGYHENVCFSHSN